MSLSSGRCSFYLRLFSVQVHDKHVSTKTYRFITVFSTQVKNRPCLGNYRRVVKAFKNVFKP